jgi:hypothetical protein
LTVRDFYAPLWPAGYLLLAGLGGFWAVLATQGAARSWVAVALLYVAANFGYYTIQHQYNDRIVRPDRKMALKIHRLLKPADRLYVLTDDLPNSTKFQTAFYNPSMYVYKDPAFQIWPAMPLPLSPDGAIAPAAVKGGNTYLLANKKFHFDRPPLKKYSTCALFQLSGGVAPLKLVEKIDPNALLARMDVRLKAEQAPTVMRAGQKVTVMVDVLNQSADPIASRLNGLAVGYHWGNFDPANLGRGAVWDDGRFAAVPDGLAQGASARVALSLRVPDVPGDRWLLTLAPLIDADARHWDIRSEHNLVIPVSIKR